MSIVTLAITTRKILRGHTFAEIRNCEIKISILSESSIQ